MTNISKIPAAQNTIEDPPEYAAAPEDPNQATPSKSPGSPEAIPQEDRGQLKWEEQRSGETEAAPSSSDAGTQTNSSYASQARHGSKK